MSIKNSVHIRKLTKAEKAVLQSVSDANNIATAAGCVQYMMAQWADKDNEIARLNRIIAYKQRKIERYENGT